MWTPGAWMFKKQIKSIRGNELEENNERDRCRSRRAWCSHMCTHMYPTYTYISHTSRDTNILYIYIYICITTGVGVLPASRYLEVTANHLTTPRTGLLSPQSVVRRLSNAGYVLAQSVLISSASQARTFFSFWTSHTYIIQVSFQHPPPSSLLCLSWALPQVSCCWPFSTPDHRPCYGQSCLAAIQIWSFCSSRFQPLRLQDVISDNITPCALERRAYITLDVQRTLWLCFHACHLLGLEHPSPPAHPLPDKF